MSHTHSTADPPYNKRFCNVSKIQCNKMDIWFGETWRKICTFDFRLLEEWYRII